MWLALVLIQKGLVTVDEMLAAVKQQQMSRPPLGRLAMLQGKLKMSQVFQVLSEQVDTSKSFGQLAIELGLMDQATLAQLLLLQSEQERPLGDILVEMGLLSPERLDFEKREVTEMVTQCLETAAPVSYN
jgi:hypothetical protein